MSNESRAAALHHVGLPVSDLDRAIQWYATALGWTHEHTARVPEGVSIAFMTAPTGERLELFALEAPQREWEGPIPALRAGIGHVGYTVPDLDAGYERALDAGGRSVWPPRDSPEPGRRMAFVADPDGNLVELIGPAAGPG